MTAKGWAIAFGTVATREPSRVSPSRPVGRVSTIAGDLFGEQCAFVPAITLWQPWASLIFSGHKRFETRGYRPPLKHIGGLIAIHAAAAMPAAKHISEELAELCYDAFGCGWNYSLPRGAVLGTVRLSGGVPTGEQAALVDADEIAAGDWTPGRWAWPLFDVQQFALPVPAKGKQGWWRLPAAIVDGTATAAANGDLPVPQDCQARCEAIAQPPPQSTRE